jgi:adenylate cyclase
MQPISRHLQLASGVVLLTYLFLHLVNHALGIWSLDLAGRGLMLAIRLWHSAPGTILLYGSAALATGCCPPPNGFASGQDSACLCC